MNLLDDFKQHLKCFPSCGQSFPSAWYSARYFSLDGKVKRSRNFIIPYTFAVVMVCLMECWEALKTL